MAPADVLPSLGILDMVQIATSLALAGPLIVATFLFATSGEFALAGFTGVLAAVAIYLPTYVIDNVLPSSLVPTRLRRLRERLRFR